MIKELQQDRLHVEIFENRTAMGKAAADAVAAKINAVLQRKNSVNIIFAAAPSQHDLLRALQTLDIPWQQVNAFHMDEYIGLDKNAPQGFGNFLKTALFDYVDLKAVFYLDGNATDPEAACDRYENLLLAYPTDIVCLGIGENTHLAFNDPHVALFDDPRLVKIVDLDEASRLQQVNDGCFANIGQVPTHAMTLTIPALFRAEALFAVVPGKTKTEAVRHTLQSDIGEKYPSTILRRHRQAILFLDQDSAQKIIA